ncbi:retrovirus-related pol polyprotein from transposon TNT 1-94 [Tanacetum coccineum]
MPYVEPALPVSLTTEPASSDEQHRASVDSAENGKMLESNIIKENDSVLITKKSILGTHKNSKQPLVLKLGQGHRKSRIQMPHKMTHRRPSTLYPKSDYHQVGWNYETQQEQLFPPSMYNQWSPYPPFPYMGQPNGNKKLLSYKAIDRGNVLFGGNTKSKIIAPRTPQSNGVVERKNRTLQEMARTMLNEQSIPQKIWCNAVDTSTYILNRILIRPFLGKTPYELFKGVFLGYSPNSKAYIVLNKETMKVEESLNVKFDKTPPPKSSPLIDDDILENDIIENKDKDLEIKENKPLNKEITNIKSSKDHPLGTVIGNLNERTLRSHVQNQSNFFCFVSSVEPKNIKEAIQDESWTMAMQEELNQFKTNDVWSLVPPLKNQTITGTKWVFKNKLDENGIVFRNKARLVAQEYNQHERIDFDETHAPVARLGSIRILLAYAYFEKPNHVFKLKKDLYGLKKAPKAWYDRLKAFLLDHLYMRLVDNTLFTKKTNSHIIIVQIYVDDIIFESTCQELCDDFSKIMHDEFEMRTMGELNFFLGLQIKQLKDGIFFNQSKYVKEMLKKFGLENSKPIKTPMSSETKLIRDKDGESIDDTKYRGMIGSLLYLTASRPDIMFRVCLCARLWYPKGTGLETIVYANSDHAGDYVDRKSTSGVCTFMGCCLTSWFSKKQTALAISTTEAEYVSTGKLANKPYG